MSASPGGSERTERSRTIEGATAVYFSETIKRLLHNEQPHTAIDKSDSNRNDIAFILGKNMARL